MDRIYLDYNATTPVLSAVVEAMTALLRDDFGNASSVHRFGQRARRAVDRARDQVAALINARPGEIIFTAGGTEADNMAVKGMFFASSRPQRHIVTSAVEHPAVLAACRWLEEQGCRVTCVPVDSRGRVDPHRVTDALTGDTILVSIMLANNETGTLQPVTEIAAAAHAAGVPVHTDAVQAVGKIPVDVQALGVDLLSLAGHKISGPKGVGALYVREGVRLDRLVHGGGHEFGLRAGTENVPAIAGFGAAAEQAAADLAAEMQRIAGLRDRLRDALCGRIPGTRLNSHPEYGLPNTLNITFDGVEGEAVTLNLDMQGIAVSSGSACHAGTIEPSAVLLAMGLDRAQALGAVRFSLGRQTTEAEIDRVIDVLPDVIAQLRG